MAKTTPTAMPAIAAADSMELLSSGPSVPSVSSGPLVSIMLIGELQLLTKKPLLERI